jgi:excisionase family DNA binding protein
MTNELLTTEEAAERLGVTSARIRAMIAAGRLPARKFGHVHMILESDLKTVEGRKPGRPPKQKIESSKKTNNKGSGRKT